MDGTNNFSELGNDPERPVRIFCDGVYDMFHYGHAKLLESVKKKFKHVWLIVGVHGDEEVLKYKGTPVMDQNERAEGAKHCKWVDEIICPSPWFVTLDFINEHNIDFVAHDDVPYPTEDCPDIYGEAKKAGKFLPTKRTAGISSSDIISRIIATPDTFILQNVAKGAATRKELRVSWPHMIWLIVKSIFVKEVKMIEEETNILEEDIKKQAKEVQVKAKEKAKELEGKAKEIQERAKEKAHDIQEKAKEKAKELHGKALNLKAQAKVKAKELHSKALDLHAKAQEKAQEFGNRIQSEARDFQTKMENRFRDD